MLGLRFPVFLTSPRPAASLLKLLGAALCLLLVHPPGVFAQDAEEETDLELLKEAFQLLEKADLSDALQDRQALQDLNVDALPEAAAVIEEAKNRVRELQANGIIAKEAVDAAAAAVTGERAREDASNSATDILGAAPEPAPNEPAAQAGDITIKNSQRFAGSLEEGVLVFEGDVLVTSDEFTLRCDKLECFLDETRETLKRAIATGRMVVIEGTSDEGPTEARCQLAVYDGEKEIMFLRIWPEVTMPGRLLRAQNKEAYIKLLVGEDEKVDPEMIGQFNISLRKPEGQDAVAP